jgi:hypothetical protein
MNSPMASCPMRTLHLRRASSASSILLAMAREERRNGNVLEICYVLMIAVQARVNAVNSKTKAISRHSVIRHNHIAPQQPSIERIRSDDAAQDVYICNTPVSTVRW